MAKVIEYTPVQKFAFDWSDLNSQINHLDDLFKKGNLNAEQADFVNGYINHINDQLENLEAYIFDMDESGNLYNNVRHAADMLTVKPSNEFLNHLDTQLSKMNLDGLEFAIAKAVEQFNSFHYSCAIYLVNKSGYVSFSGCGMESNERVTVLFNKSDRNKVTIADVKRKMLEFNNSPITGSGLSLRNEILLNRHGIKTIGQLVKMSDTDLMRVRNMGRKGIDEIKEFLNSL